MGDEPFRSRWAVFIAAELSRRGIIATVTVRNARAIVILSSNSAATKSVNIQVKTNQFNDPKWMLHKSDTQQCVHFSPREITFQPIAVRGKDSRSNEIGLRSPA
jgi:hypothetical protein